MKTATTWFKSLSKLQIIAAIVLIIVGVALTAYYGTRAVRSFRELQYIHEQGLDRGEANVEAIRPWMTIRFVAVAYAVPEEYLYSQIGIPFERRNANRSLGDLNRDYGFGPVPNSLSLEIIEKTKAAIVAYRANPVATGLRDVRGWMSIRYIANSTGVPAEYLFKSIGVPLTDNDYKPLDLLSNEIHYPNGPRGLSDALQRALTDYENK